ncbi:hypothetical protein PSM7751_02972 [Pseudooceanicola marinus]|uniref:Tyrosine specific protein phosphatases domain-containing protein n=2 Tax=Pseudooceanicola marinus TaxID=396013 RepID=A0A1X6ZSE8_9RHOB|nr:hypothetical protein PSM7751_02972 [Pseudooceanicola marinus]
MRIATRDSSAVRAAIPMPRGGACLMTGFPGLETGVDGSGYIDPIALEDTFADLADHGVRLLLVLPEERELPGGSFALLRAQLARHGIEGLFLPVVDFHAPDAGFLQEWADLGPTLHRIMAEGGRIAACCQYGAGRSGLTAAWLLIEQGLDASAAVALVRSHFEDAVESEAQLQFLQSRAPAAVGTTPGQHSHSNK